MTRLRRVPHDWQREDEKSLSSLPNSHLMCQVPIFLLNCCCCFCQPALLYDTRCGLLLSSSKSEVFDASDVAVVLVYAQREMIATTT